MPISPIRLPAPPQFELWLVPLAGEACAADADLLDDEERDRAARLVFDRDRRRYVAAHAALRRLLGARTGQAPGALCFEAGAFGKPRLRGEPRCAFSLSHSGDHALVALADDGEIGVDIETFGGPMRDVDGLAAQCLSERELFDFQATAASERELAFLHGWTRKEACLKALGIGLRIEPSKVDVGLRASAVTVCVDTAEGSSDVLVQSLEPGSGWVAAVARVLARPKRGISAGNDTLYSHV